MSLVLHGRLTATIWASSVKKVKHINSSVVSTINEGKVHIIEPDLDKELLMRRPAVTCVQAVSQRKQIFLL